MSTSLFTNPETPSFDPDKDYVAEYLAPGGKFYDEDPEVAKKKLARAKAEADYTIKLREAEQAELRKDYLSLREEYEAVPRLQSLIDQLTNQQQSLTSNELHPDVNEDKSKPAFDPDDIEAILERRDAKKREQENLNLVQNKLVERFGPNYNSHLKTYREELGMSAEEVDTMARTNPKAFERLFLSNPKAGESYEAPPRGSIRSDNFAPKTEKRTWKFYENMRTANPTVYWEPKTINQMHEDRKALGPDFYS